jgi:hypothetical protein
MKKHTIAFPSMIVMAALIVIGCNRAGTTMAAASQNNLPAYDVRFTFTGMSGSLAGTAGCPARPNGTATMTGLLSGNEAVKADDDIEYTGTLTFTVDVDMCEADRFSNGEDKLCAIDVKASGPLHVELSVYADNRGGYVKAGGGKGTWKPRTSGQTPAPNAPWMSVGGSCTSALVAAEAAVFPDGSQASVFNGEELNLPSGPLQKKTYQVGTNMALEVLKKVR